MNNMKRVGFLILFLLVITPLFGQNQPVDSKTDSLLTRIDNAISSLSNNLQSKIGRYKIYPTTNNYTSLRLDTATGKIWALQIGVGENGKQMEYSITNAVTEDGTVIGRYELYPTKNNYNFILLDTILGIAYQVQWSTKQEECGRWIFY
jgi:hypothetical protein